jgi:hypothetical protein
MLGRLLWCGHAETRSVACVGVYVVKKSQVTQHKLNCEMMITHFRVPSLIIIYIIAN